MRDPPPEHGDLGNSINIETSTARVFARRSGRELAAEKQLSTLSLPRELHVKVLIPEKAFNLDVRLGCASASAGGEAGSLCAQISVNVGNNKRVPVLIQRDDALHVRKLPSRRRIAFGLRRTL